MKNNKFKASVVAIAAIAASPAAMAQSSVTLYGMLDAGISYTSNVNGHSLVSLVGGASGFEDGRSISLRNSGKARD